MTAKAKSLYRSFLVRRLTTVTNEETDGLGRLPLSVFYNERKKMPKYKVHFVSDVYETIEVEANSPKEAEYKFLKGDVDLADAKEEVKENLKVDTVEEIKN